MLTFPQWNPAIRFALGTFPTLTVVGIIAMIKFPSWSVALFVLAHILLTIYTSSAFTFNFLLQQCSLLQRDLDLLEKDYTLQVVSPATFPNAANFSGAGFFIFIAVKPKHERVEQITSFHAYPWNWKGTVVLSPSIPLGSKVQDFLLFHEIGHALSTSVTHHWYQQTWPIRELVRYMPAVIVTYGWTATVILGLLYVADCFSSFVDFDGPEIDADYFAARALVSQHGEQFASASIRLACYALHRRAELEINDRRKFRRREKILQMVRARLTQINSQDNLPYGFIFRLISQVRLLTMLAAIWVVSAFCKAPSLSAALFLFGMFVGAFIHANTLKGRLIRDEVVKLRDLMSRMIDKQQSDADAYEKLMKEFAPASLENPTLTPLFSDTRFTVSRR